MCERAREGKYKLKRGWYGSMFFTPQPMGKRQGIGVKIWTKFLTPT
jgi:hypothetical protein